MKITVSLTSTAKSGSDNNLRQVCFRVREGDTDLRTRTELLANPEYWDGDIPGYRRTTKLSKEEIQSFNKRIADITALIHEGYNENCDGTWLRELVKRYLHPEDYVSGQDEAAEDGNCLIAHFRRYLSRHAVSKGRMCCMKSTLKKLQRYELYQRQMKGRKGFTLYLDTLEADDLRDIWEFIGQEYQLYESFPAFYEQFKMWRNKQPVPMSSNGMSNIFKHIRSFLNWSIKQGLTTNERWRGFTVRQEAYGTPIYLTLEERDRILDMDLGGFPRLERHRDMFIFQCLIGCRMGDLYRMTNDNIKGDFIEYYPHKGIGGYKRDTEGMLCRVPLNEKAKALLEKHRDPRRDTLFPCLNKTLYNEDIKVIVMLSGIDRMVVVPDPKTREMVERPLYTEVTTHTARKTFIANLYKLVKDPNLIASMTGHCENSRAFRRYREIDDDMKEEIVCMID